MSKDETIANLILAADEVLAKHIATSEGHGGNCQCRACTEGPWLVHDQYGCILSFCGHKETEINGVAMTCGCGLLTLQRAVEAAKATM